MCSPHCPKQIQLLLESLPPMVSRDLCLSQQNSDETRSVSLSLVFFSVDGGRGEWETSKEAKWRMSWSAMIQQNFIFSLVLTISIKILQIAANFSPSAWFDYWVLWAAQTQKSPCKHQPLYLAWSFKIALKMKFLEHFSCHTKYFFPPSFPSKWIQKNVKWGWEKWAEGN